MADKNNTARGLVYVSLSAAIIAVCSLISFPIGPVPITLQPFAIAFAGMFLGSLKGASATAVYIAIGMMGVPVFAGFKGGVSVVAGPTGGFIVGFLLMALLCGLGKKTYNRIIFSASGLLACHLLGIIWYSLYAAVPFINAFMLVSLPFLIKDAASVAVAFILSDRIKKALYR